MSTIFQEELVHVLTSVQNTDITEHKQVETAIEEQVCINYMGMSWLNAASGFFLI